MKKVKLSNGFTLIEVIVSLAIIAIIAVSMLSLFSTGLLNISRSGSRTANTEAATYNLMTQPEIISEKKALIIKLGESEADKVQVNGHMVRGVGTIPGSYGNIQIEITAFLPDSN